MKEEKMRNKDYVLDEEYELGHVITYFPTEESRTEHLSKKDFFCDRFTLGRRGFFGGVKYDKHSFAVGKLYSTRKLESADEFDVSAKIKNDILAKLEHQNIPVAFCFKSGIMQVLDKDTVLFDNNMRQIFPPLGGERKIAINNDNVFLLLKDAIPVAFMEISNTQIVR